MATPAVERLRTTVRALTVKTEALLSDCDATFLTAKMVAEDLEKHNDPDSVLQLQEAALDLVSTSHSLRSSRDALDALAASYHPPTSDVPTDFRSLLQSHVEALEGPAPFDPEKHEFMKQFKEAIWRVHHGGEPMPGQEQEEIVVMAGSQTLPNTSCPLSGKPVDQLENPVRSQDCKHIYERDVVLAHVRRHEAQAHGRRRHPCRCAAAGCPGTLIEERLVCDRSLKIEIREYMLRQQSSNVDTVADCTYLEEEDDDTPLKGFGTR